MGILSGLLGAAAPIVGGIFGGPAGSAIGGLLGSAISGNGQPSSAQSSQSGTQNGTQNGTSTTALDPKIAQLLGTSGDGGLLSHLTGAMDTTSPIAAAGQQFTGNNAGQILNNGYAGTNSLMGAGYMAPSIQAAQVNAPSQNGMNLSGSYDRFINGTPGANPYLDQSIQGTIDQNRLGFNQLQDDSTRNLMQNVLPSIRSNSVLSGQYGGSRQGVAEGNAIGTQQTELNRAAAQFGQNATNAAVGAKTGAYETDSNRALSATQGLGAQQYGVAQQDALARQAGDNTNVNALLSTRNLNSSNLTNGIQMQQGILNSAAGYGNADLTRLGQTAGILSPFLNAGATTTNNSTTTSQTTGNGSQPLYQNQAGNMLGGAMAGLGLYNQFAGGGTDFSGVRNNDNYGTNVGSSSVFNVPSSASTYTPPTTVALPSLPNLWG